MFEVLDLVENFALVILMYKGLSFPNIPKAANFFTVIYWRLQIWAYNKCVGAKQDKYSTIEQAKTCFTVEIPRFIDSVERLNKVVCLVLIIIS